VSPAAQIPLAMMAIGLLATIVGYLISPAAGTSALLATACVLIPTSYFAWLQARTLNAVRVLMHGVLKILLTLTLVGVSIAVIGIDPKAFFLTFVAVQLGYFSPALFGQSGL